VPANDNCAVRLEVEAFAVTVKETVAVPVPLETSGVSQDALSLTCQVQPLLVVTVTLSEPALADSVTVPGITV